MRQFLSSLLNRTQNTESISEPKVYVFGKHPCWDDHIEDIASPTETLSGLKSFLYTQALASHIESGSWEKLAESGHLAPFDHVFYWSFRGFPLVGSIHGSRDGKGRDKYPLVVVIQLPTASTLVMRVAWQEKAYALGKDLLDSDSKTLFLNLVQKAETDLKIVYNQEVTDAESRGLGPNSPIDVSEADSLSVARLYYEVVSRHSGWNESPKLQGCSVSRVRPHTPGLPVDAFWIRIIHALIFGRGDYLMLKSCAGGWIDILVGNLQPDGFYCLRANEAALPRSDAIPYQLEESHLIRSRQLLEIGRVPAERN